MPLQRSDTGADLDKDIAEAEEALRVMETSLSAGTGGGMEEGGGGTEDGAGEAVGGGVRGPKTQGPVMTGESLPPESALSIGELAVEVETGDLSGPTASASVELHGKVADSDLVEAREGE